MRLFFIPGLGEEGFVFEKIAPFIPGEKIFIENWDLLKKVPGKRVTVVSYAEFLIEKFSIQKNDVVIGHSMGGWVGLFIKQITGCSLIQIASWSDGKKIIPIPLPRPIMFWLVKNRLGFFPIARDIIVWLRYRHEPSKEIFTKVYERLRTGDSKVAMRQLEVIFNTVNLTIAVQPDLRIHSKRDNIVRPPDEPFVAVPSDHFTLYTHPVTVYKPILELLNKLS